MRLTAETLAAIAADPTRADIPRLIAALQLAEAERDFAQRDAAALRMASEPFRRFGWSGMNWPDAVPLTLTVSAGDMRWLNLAVGGNASQALRLNARLGQLVAALPYQSVLWRGDPQWRIGHYDEQRRRWSWGEPHNEPEEALKAEQQEAQGK